MKRLWSSYGLRKSVVFELHAPIGEPWHGCATEGYAPALTYAFEVDLHSGELRKHGIKPRLPEQSFQVLQALMERDGRVVSRAELKQKIWSGGYV